MVFVEFDARVQHAWTQRAKLAVQMLTTTAYGTLGFGFGEPVLRGSPFGLAHLAALAIGMISAYIALLLAPQGERREPI